MSTIATELARSFSSPALTSPIDFTVIRGRWATPCMCGHGGPHAPDIGHHSGMQCSVGGCECGDFERQPGMPLPDRKRSVPIPWSDSGEVETPAFVTPDRLSPSAQKAWNGLVPRDVKVCVGDREIAVTLESFEITRGIR